MQKYFYDKQEFHRYGKPYCAHLFLPQVSNYRDITFRINAGMDSLSNTSRECSINPAEWQKRQTAVVSPAPLFTNVCRASGCQNMVWGSICHPVPTPLPLPPHEKRIMLSWTQTVRCQPVPVICGGLLVMLIPSLFLSLSSTHFLTHELCSKTQRAASLSTSF